MFTGWVTAVVQWSLCCAGGRRKRTDCSSQQVRLFTLFPLLNSLFLHSQILKPSTDYYAGFAFEQSNSETVYRLLCWFYFWTVKFWNCLQIIMLVLVLHSRILKLSTDYYAGFVFAVEFWNSQQVIMPQHMPYTWFCWSASAFCVKCFVGVWYCLMIHIDFYFYLLPDIHQGVRWCSVSCHNKGMYN